jgi:8-oxo-dGTP pyrophosphatase MutT (NUDIX family)
VPAASAVLLRDRPSGLEALLLRRTSAASFAPGAWVFPGGRVDPGDMSGEIGSDTSAELAAARRAAVRETAEEAGLMIDGAELTPLACWCPPARAPRRFLTWIMIGRAPEQDVVVDGGEITDYRWMRPAEALIARDQGDLDLLPPTWVTLWTLAGHPTVADALAATSAAPPELFETRITKVPGGAVALWQDDAEYDVADRRDTASSTGQGGRHRLWMLDTGWRYERAPSAGAIGEAS